MQGLYHEIVIGAKGMVTNISRKKPSFNEITLMKMFNKFFVVA